MQSINYDWGIILHAFTYSSNFLIFSLSIVIASVLGVWLYEKPLFYKLIFKRSVHLEDTPSAKPSEEQFSLVDDEVSIVLPQKMTTDSSMDRFECAKASESY